MNYILLESRDILVVVENVERGGKDISKNILQEGIISGEVIQLTKKLSVLTSTLCRNDSICEDLHRYEI